MADNVLSVVENEDKGLVYETLDETIYLALGAVKAALDRIYWYHEDDLEMLESIIIIQRLVAAAEDRFNAFDEGMRQHLGYVGLFHEKLEYVGMDKREYVGCKFVPKDETAKRQDKEAA